MDKLLDKVLIARCMYANGITYISDAEYDEAVIKLRSQGCTLNPIYEDDPIPYEAFERVMGKSHEEVDSMLLKNKAAPTSIFSQSKELAYDFLAETESLSIMPVFSFEDAYNLFVAHRNLEIIISAKIDGINTRRGYMRDGDALKYVASLTRGRKSDPLDVTDNMAYISPTKISVPGQSNLLLYSETVTTQSAISAINEKYGDSYTIPRGLAVAMMRTDKFSSEDYEYLKSFVFRVDYGEKLSDGLEMAAGLGFLIVPYVTYTYKDETFDMFKKNMQEIIAKLKFTTDSWDIVTDGMVAEVNDRSRFSLEGVSNNYSSANLAMKIGLWQPGVYTSVVKSLDLCQQAERCTCVAIVEPVIAKGGQTITRVNCFNPSVLFDNNILPGTEIKFEYKNETTVNLLLGD